MKKTMTVVKIGWMSADLDFKDFLGLDDQTCLKCINVLISIDCDFVERVTKKIHVFRIEICK